jgi:hypothetical protein
MCCRGQFECSAGRVRTKEDSVAGRKIRGRTIFHFGDCSLSARIVGAFGRKKPAEFSVWAIRRRTPSDAGWCRPLPRVYITTTRRAASIESAAQMAAGHGHPLVCGWDDDPGNSGDSGFLQIEPHVHRTVAAGSFPPSSRRVSERRRARSTNQGKRQPPYWLSSCRGSTRKPPSASKCSGSTT